MAKKLTNIVGGILLAGSLVGAGGCGQQVQDAFYNDPLNSAVISTMPRFLQPGGYRDAQERKSQPQQQENVNVPQQRYTSQGQLDNKNNNTPTGLFAFNKLHDLNNNDIAERLEFFGLGKRVFNLNKERMSVGIYAPNYRGNVIFKSWTPEGKLIGETKKYVSKNRVVYYYTEKDCSDEKDFMNYIKWAGPGDYKISATLDNGETNVIDVTIVE